MIKKWVEEREKTYEILSISLWLKCKNIFCFKSLSKLEKFYLKLYRRSEEIINYNMDMINYLKFMQEYIHLKCLLFNDFQSLCLSFIRKPKVYEKNRFLKINSHSYKKLKELIIYVKSHKNIMKNEKIFSLISEDVKNLILSNQ
jgi:hypothetical protein